MLKSSSVLKQHFLESATIKKLEKIRKRSRRDVNSINSLRTFFFKLLFERKILRNDANCWKKKYTREDKIVNYFYHIFFKNKLN